jgi:hypothetical protein
MQGVDGATEALSSVCSRAQLQTKRIIDHAQALSAMSTKLAAFSSEAEAIVNDAECAVAAVRSAAYNAGRERVKGFTKRADDEAEARTFLPDSSNNFPTKPHFLPAVVTRPKHASSRAMRLPGLDMAKQLHLRALEAPGV